MTASDPASRKATPVTVDEILTALGTTWDAGDSVALSALFERDADFVDVLGRRQKGRAVIEREHRALFDSIYAGSTCRFRLVAQRPLGDGVSLLHTASVLSVPSGPRRGDTFASQTMIVRDGRVTAFHNSVQADLEGFIGERGSFGGPDGAGHGAPEPRDPTIS